MSSKQDDANQAPIPKEIMPGQAYMARSSKNKWPEPHHWLTGRQSSSSSQIQQESSTQPSSQPRESSLPQLPAGSKDSTQSHQDSQATLDKPDNENPVEDEYLSLNAGLTPSAANAGFESSHPVRQRRKATEEDPWTASLEQAGGVDYHGSEWSATGSSRLSHSLASSQASVYHDAEEEPSQKQQSGPTTPAKSGSKRSNEAGDSSARQETRALADNPEEQTEDFVFLM